VLTLSAVLLQPDIRTAIKNSDITFFILFLYDISEIETNFQKGKRLFILSLFCGLILFRIYPINGVSQAGRLIAPFTFSA
jgi:hypothetical protein